MSQLTVARNAIAAEIKHLISEQARLHAILKTLGSDDEPPAVKSGKGAGKSPDKGKRRLRLKDDVAADISSKVLKAIKAHRDGASRRDILTYLARNGYEVGHHFNEPHLSKLVSNLLGGDAPAIRREGDKGSAKYFTA